MIRSRCSFIAAVLPLVLLTSSCASGATSRAFGPGRQVGIVQSELIREASGIVASRQNPGVLWVHNDSGDSARIFAIDEKARLLGVCDIRGATARDWEDIAIGPGPDPNRQYLYIGDIGDNRARRPEITIYRLAEPRIDVTSRFGQMVLGPPDAIRLTYPDGPRDAETLLVDPLTRDIVIVSKREFFSRVYRAAWPQSTAQATRMERVATLPWGFAVAGDVSPDGRRVIVRGMFNASLWVRSPDRPLWEAFAGKQVRLPLMNEPQGEGICFDAQGTGYYTIGETAGQMPAPPLHYFGPAEPNAPGS